MLELSLKGGEWFDDLTQTFVYTQSCVVSLEHSLLSLSRWESKWKKPLLSQTKLVRTNPHEVIDYFCCMLVEPCPEPNWTWGLTNQDMQRILDYCNEEQTATTFHSYRPERGVSREVITSEVIYYWMAALHIPFTCETWHLSRLLTLIHVASIKGHTGQKMPKQDIRQMYAEINEKRKRQYHTRG